MKTQHYALKIRKSDLALLTLLNGGVTPKIEKTTTYLIICPDDSGPNEIVTQRELDQRFEVKSNSPMLFALKK